MGEHNRIGEPINKILSYPIRTALYCTIMYRVLSYRIMSYHILISRNYLKRNVQNFDRIYYFNSMIIEKKNCKIYFKSLLFISLKSDTEVD